ncbi:MAG TPA: DUF4129 domain-containing protein [Myxococcales bacterium]|nr:DUF4129 domain-containing protein [Myxococcales bacterium]
MIAIALLLALDLAGYRQQLQSIDAQLAHGDSAGAATAAQKLLNDQLDGGLSPDAWVLRPIADGKPRRARLQILLQTLQAAPRAGLEINPGILQEVRARQTAALGKAGGELGDIPLREPSLLRSLVDGFTDAMEWIWDKVARFFKWLDDLFPDSQPGPQSDGKSGVGGVTTPVLVLVGIILVFLIALAVRAALRPEPKRPDATSDKTLSKKDDDPLSRTASGWEERAAALAAEGRFREAIRAWYHALLVHAAGAGVLRYQRGRTNWEYVALLSPALSWRPVFAELTRLFEREWYGRAESREEELELFRRDARQVLAALRSAA